MNITTSTPLRWEVRLNGTQADLERLAETLRGPDLLITALADEFYLGGSAFDDLPNPDATRDVAGVLATALSASLLIKPHLTVGPIVRLDADGSRPMWIHPSPAVLELVAFPPIVKVAGADGVLHDLGVERARENALKALSSEAARKAQRLLLGGKLGWVELVRIFEVIKGDGGVPRGSENWKQGRRLKGTANSVAITGDECRHGWEDEDKAPPSDPMTISEARDFIYRLVAEWMGSK